MKTLKLQTFEPGGTIATQSVQLDASQEEMVNKYGWPDALMNDTGVKDEQKFALFALEDYDGESATYTKVPHPLFVCQPPTQP